MCNRGNLSSLNHVTVSVFIGGILVATLISDALFNIQASSFLAAEISHFELIKYDVGSSLVVIVLIFGLLSQYMSMIMFTTL